MLSRIISVLSLFLLLACHQSVPGTCKKDTDCQEGVCVFGKCQECSVDAHCKDSKTCHNNQCQKINQAMKTCVDSVDCDAGMSCQGGFCMVSKPRDQIASCEMVGTVYFDFNVYEIKSEGRDLLTELASCMRSNPDQKLVIAGNTDDRGTVEYNLALGEKRAQAVARYLQNSGINDSRMHVVSYGKEKPVDLAQNEEAWAKNRRTDIILDN